MMLKKCFTQQIKQKVLNYEIQTIQTCTDSLFNQSSCQHQRYLSWQLGETLTNLLKHCQHQYRWIGNDSNAYVYAYFYLLVIGCAADPGSMLELKLALYDLSQKYLAQYQQKLLIEFLCLIEYSQDRYLFFRKYSKIEGILLKIFKEVEQRSQKFDSNHRDSMDELTTFSKLTTCITSPANRNSDQHFSKLLRNSDYYNSSMKRVEKEYQKAIANKNRKTSNPSRYRYIQWYQLYNKIFYFVEMKVHAEKHVQMTMKFQKRKDTDEEFIITIEKGCFFVIELKRLSRQADLHVERQKKYSTIEESEIYLNKLIEKQMEESKILKKVKIQSSKQSKTSSLSGTPKFITNRKSRTFEGNTFYKQALNDSKKVNIQVLQISQFNDNRDSLSDCSIEQKYDNIQNRQTFSKKQNICINQIGCTTQTLNNYQELPEDIRRDTLFQGVMKERASRTQKQMSGCPAIPKRNNPPGNKHYRNPESKCSINNEDLNNVNGNISVNKTINHQKIVVKNINQSKTMNLSKEEMKKLYPGKIVEQSPHQTVLSAAMLRKSYKYLDQNRAKLIKQAERGRHSRPFYSNSPPAQNNNQRCQFYSPGKLTLIDRTKAFVKPPIKFTYK